jgi:microcystin-dependent protein
MAEPYIGEIRMFAGDFAPVDWAICNGAIMAISQNPALYNLIGTTYGGDGETTFALPNLQSRVPLHQGQRPGSANYVIGGQAGAESVTLATAQIPLHNHSVGASTAVPPPASGAIDVTAPQAHYVPATPVKPRVYASPSGNSLAPMNAVGVSGGAQPHNNMAPYLSINFIIALYGVFPSQN